MSHNTSHVDRYMSKIDADNGPLSPNMLKGILIRFTGAVTIMSEKRVDEYVSIYAERERLPQKYLKNILMGFINNL